LNLLNCTDREVLVEDCASGQSLIQEFRSATEGDIVTTIVLSGEKPDDLKDCWQAVPAMASVSRGNAQ
jgi:hypothetical protein